MRRYVDSYNSIKTAIFYDDQKTGGDKLSKQRDRTCCLYYAIACNYSDNFNETLEVIDKELLYLFPNDPTLIEAKAFALCEEKKIDECLELCRKYPKMKNELDYYVAKCKYYQKNFGSANQILEDLIDKDPDKTIKENAFSLKAKICIAQKDDEMAIMYYNEALNLNEGNISLIVEIANFYLKNGDVQFALQILNRGEKHIDYETQQEFELLWV